MEGLAVKLVTTDVSDAVHQLILFKSPTHCSQHLMLCLSWDYVNGRSPPQYNDHRLMNLSV